MEKVKMEHSKIEHSDVNITNISIELGIFALIAGIVIGICAVHHKKFKKCKSVHHPKRELLLEPEDLDFNEVDERLAKAL